MSAPDHRTPPAALIPPDLRARLAPLRLRMRRPAAAPGHGTHASRHRGAGLEFAQYRGYEPGDEPRHVDWKLYARSDRFFVREAERESPLTAWLLVDAVPLERVLARHLRTARDGVDSTQPAAAGISVLGCRGAFRL